MGWLADVDAIVTQRRRDYAHPLLNFLRIAIFWNAYLGDVRITPVDVAMLMNLMKIARHMQTPKEDNFVDLIGYTVCVEAMHEMMQRIGYAEGIRAFDTIPARDYPDLIARIEQEVTLQLLPD
jgi:hypothetical protein